jgi:hypothetical protein
MTVIERYHRLGLWSRVSFWGSLASIIALLAFFLSPQQKSPADSHTEVARNSPGATVLQSGRDIVINAPPIPSPTRPAAEGEAISAPQASKPAAGKPQGNAISQTMTNSPGGIQAAGNVVVTSDRRLITSIVLRVAVEAETSPATPTEVQTDVGLSSALALFTTDKTRIRFVTDFMIQDQQLSATRRRLSFVYTPETSEQVLGKPIEFLGSIGILAVNYAEIFRTERFNTAREGTRLNCSVIVNGISVAMISTDVQPFGALASGQVNVNVAEAFARIPASYASAVSR